MAQRKWQMYYYWEDGHWHWEVRAGNGFVMARSRRGGYTDESSLHSAMETVRKRMRRVAAKSLPLEDGGRQLREN